MTPAAMTEQSKSLVLASRNRGKLGELETLLAPHGWQVQSLCTYTDIEVAETAPTYIENALCKARAASRASGLPAIADDSGLEVEALNGAPGVRSARFAGDGATDRDNLQHLLNILDGIPQARRGACFRCLVVYLRRPDDGAPLIAEAIWRGRILEAPRGRGGFGYDPVFYLPDRDCSAAELAAADKNLLSHRGRAVRALVQCLLQSRV